MSTTDTPSENWNRCYADFLVTKEYRRFEEFCNACRRYRYIGLCYGPPGVGKTLSARYYTRWDLIEGLELFDDPPPELKGCRSIYYTPAVNNTPRTIKAELAKRINSLSNVAARADTVNDTPDWMLETRAYSVKLYRERCELIIVDEADRLKMPTLEQLRDIYDRIDTGLILIGMPGLEKRLARYPQLYSRVGFAHAYRPLSQEEMLFILEHHWEKLGSQLERSDFTSQEAVAAIVRATSGNFRLVNRLFAQIERILKINDLQTITKEVVEAARDCLVIGAN